MKYFACFVTDIFILGDCVRWRPRTLYMAIFILGDCVRWRPRTSYMAISGKEKFWAISFTIFVCSQASTSRRYIKIFNRYLVSVRKLSIVTTVNNMYSGC